MRNLPVLCALAVGMGLTACDQHKDDKKVTISTPDGKVTMSGNGENFTVKSDDGKSSVTMSANGAATASKVPPYVSVYPGATVRSTVIGAAAAGGGGMVAYTTSASPEQVLAFHKDKTKAAGLKETMNVSSQGTMSFTATDEATKRTVQVTVNKSGDGTTLAQAVWSTGNN